MNQSNPLNPFYKSSKIEVAKRIKKLRLSKGLTQTVLSKYLGCSKSAFCSYEKGKMIPKNIDKLAEVLGVGIDYFLDDTCYHQAEYEEEKKVNEFLERLESDRAITLRYSDVLGLHLDGKGLRTLPNDIKSKILSQGFFLCLVDKLDFS